MFVPFSFPPLKLNLVPDPSDLERTVASCDECQDHAKNVVDEADLFQNCKQRHGKKHWDQNAKQDQRGLLILGVDDGGLPLLYLLVEKFVFRHNQIPFFIKPLRAAITCIQETSEPHPVLHGLLLRSLVSVQA